MPIAKELLDELMKDYQGPEDLLGETGLLNQLKKALLEREIEEHLINRFLSSSPESLYPPLSGRIAIWDTD